MRTKIMFILFVLYYLSFMFIIIFIANRKAKKDIEEARRYFLPYAYKFSHRLFRWMGIKVTIVGEENLKRLEEKDNFYIISNHQSVFDAPLILGFTTKDIFFLLKKELKSTPVYSTFVDLLGVAIDRKNPQQAAGAIRKVIRLSQNGKNIAIFAEGTRSRDGKLLPFKPGSLRIAMMAKKPILPVVISGTVKILPKGKLLPQKEDIKLTFLDPIDTTQYKDENVLSDFVFHQMNEVLNEN